MMPVDADDDDESGVVASSARWHCSTCFAPWMYQACYHVICHPVIFILSLAWPDGACAGARWGSTSYCCFLRRRQTDRQTLSI